MPLVKLNSVELTQQRLQPAEPMWKRVPTRSDDGRPLSDFMMLIPGLRQWPRTRQEMTVAAIQQVLDCYRQTVVFADLNLRLSLLWVSVLPVPGICLELPTALAARVPEAKLVAQRPT